MPEQTKQKSEKQQKLEQEAQKRLELDTLRAQVQEDELVARSHKAHYDSMYFYMKLREIEPDFYTLRNKEVEAYQKQQEDIQAQIQQQVEAQNDADKEVISEPQGVEPPEGT